jgi:alpha-mannosidase
MMDDLCMEDDNVGEYVDKFIAAAHAYANNTRSAGSATQNIMFLMGSDFQYENADGWYKNLDKIIHHVNADGRVNAFYSTPVEYTAAKFAEVRALLGGHTHPKSVGADAVVACTCTEQV